MITIAIDDLKSAYRALIEVTSGIRDDAEFARLTRFAQSLAEIIEKTEGTGATSIQLVGIIPSEILRRIEPRNRCKLCGVESLAGQACDECGYRSKSGGGER